MNATMGSVIAFYLREGYAARHRWRLNAEMAAVIGKQKMGK
ncbi:MAG: hypothetical protein ACLQMF_01475 [Rectinemataceae bacterium]